MIFDTRIIRSEFPKQKKSGKQAVFIHDDGSSSSTVPGCYEDSDGFSYGVGDNGVV